MTLFMFSFNIDNYALLNLFHVLLIVLELLVLLGHKNESMGIHDGRRTWSTMKKEMKEETLNPNR